MRILAVLFMLVVAQIAFTGDAEAADAAVAMDAMQATSLPVTVSVPVNTSEALDAGKEVVAMAKTKQWFAMSAGIIWLLMFLFKTGRKKLDFMAGIPKRVLWIVLPLLSVAAMLLAKFQGDLSWAGAVGVLTSGPSVAFLNDFVKRGVLNKEPTPMKEG